MNNVDDWLKTPAPIYSGSCSSFSEENSSITSNQVNWENYVEEDGSLFYAEFEYFEEKARNIKRKSMSECNLSSFKLSNVTSAKTLEIELIITSEDRYRFGRRSSPFEAILGFNVCPFPDNNSCLMVSGMLTNSTIDKMNLVSIGSWFKQINDIDIRMDNLDDVLMQFSQPTNVTLKFQGVSRNGFEGIDKVVNLKDFQAKFKDILKCNYDIEEIPFYLVIEPLSSNGTHCFYPEQEKNLFSKAKGSFITLNSILINEFKSAPLMSVIKNNEIQYFVHYKIINSHLFLMIFSEKHFNKKESSFRSNEFFKYINLISKDGIDFENVLKLCQIATISYFSKYELHEFHDYLKELPYLPLPKEAQLRIFDACSELEAMDYRVWNNAPLNSHREFFIIGHALYKKSTLISHTLKDDLLQYTHLYMKYNGIFKFIESISCKILLTWSVVPLASDIYLTICGKNNFLFANILQAYIPFNEAGSNMIVKPSLFYMEEIEDTLDHLIGSGIGSLSNAWDECNKRPEMRLIEKRLSNHKHVEEKEENLESDDSDEDWKEFPTRSMSNNTDAFNWKEVEKMLPLKLTSSKFNAMLKFINLNKVKMTTNYNSVQFKFIADKYFQFLYKVMEYSKNIKQDLHESHFTSNKALVTFKEFGITVKYKKDKFAQFMNISFVARLFPAPLRELYVAYLSDYPQNLVELEYRIASLVAG